MEDVIKGTSGKVVSVKTAVSKPAPKTVVQSNSVGEAIPKELLSSFENADKMIRDHNIEVRLIIGPNTPTEKTIQLKSVARAIKAHFSD